MEFPLWEKEDLICLIPHEVLDGVEGLAQPSGGFLAPRPWVTPGLGTVSTAQLMAPRGAGLVSSPNLAQAMCLVDKEEFWSCVLQKRA